MEYNDDFASLFDQEIKTALQVNIVSQRSETTGSTLLLNKQTQYYYVVQLSKIHSGEQRYIEKRMTDFYQLYEDLKSRAYINLPRLPGKTARHIKDPEELETRRQELVRFLRDLINRRDTRNS